MLRFFWIVSAVGFLAIAATWNSSQSTSEPARADEKQPARRASGLDKRELWTTSKVKGSPEPPAPYQIAKSYPKLTFEEPLELATVPGRKIWVVAERKGKIWTFDATAKE